MLASVFGCGIHILARSAGEIQRREQSSIRECSQNKGKQNLLKSSGRSQPSALLHVFKEMAGTFLPSSVYRNSKRDIKHRLRNRDL